MDKNKNKKMNGKSVEKMKQNKDADVVKNQIIEDYQNGVAEDELTNNRGIYTFNNQKN